MARFAKEMIAPCGMSWVLFIVFQRKKSRAADVMAQMPANHRTVFPVSSKIAACCGSAAWHFAMRAKNSPAAGCGNWMRGIEGVTA